MLLVLCALDGAESLIIKPISNSYNYLAAMYTQSIHTPCRMTSINLIHCKITTNNMSLFLMDLHTFSLSLGACVISINRHIVDMCALNISQQWCLQPFPLLVVIRGITVCFRSLWLAMSSLGNNTSNVPVKRIVQARDNSKILYKFKQPSRHFGNASSGA